MKNKNSCSAGVHGRADKGFGLSIENKGVMKNRIGIITGILLVLAVIGFTGVGADLDPGLVALWHMDEGSGDIIYDETTNNNDGTIYGATWTDGICGNALSFDGVNDLVSVPDDSIWTLGSDPFTIALWVKFNEIKYRSPFIGHDEGGGDRDKWIFWFDNLGHDQPSGPALRFLGHNAPTSPHDPVYAPWNPNTGQWYHVAVTRSGNTYALYIDGVQVATGTDSNTIPDPNAPLTIGKAEAYFLNGLIDEVAIYSRALTAEEILQHYENPCGLIEATVDIDPDTLNLKSKGEWITAYIELPEGYDVNDIDVSTIYLVDTIPVDTSAPATVGDYDSDGISDLMVKFDRIAVVAYLGTEDVTEDETGTDYYEELTIIGELTDGTQFEGSDTIRVIDKGKSK
jgi:hypothetical protein